eukprot:2636620-Pyramimonas_sp.AAC.1
MGGRFALGFSFARISCRWRRTMAAMNTSGGTGTMTCYSAARRTRWRTVIEVPSLAGGRSRGTTFRSSAFDHQPYLELKPRAQFAVGHETPSSRGRPALARNEKANWVSCNMNYDVCGALQDLPVAPCPTSSH